MIDNEWEQWMWCALSLGIIVARFVSRRLLVRAWRLQADDWVMLLVALFYIASVTVLTYLYIWDLKWVDVEELPDNYEYLIAISSILTIAFEHLTLATVWLCKACMLIMFYRMTFNLRQNLAIQVVAVITGVTYLFIVVAFFLWCQPLGDYLSSDYDNISEQCTTGTNHMISVAVCNSATDLLILGITVPMFIRSRMPLRKKIPVVILFSLGLITVAVTMANRIMAITVELFNFYRWTMREISLSVFVTNLPLTVPLWNRTKNLTSGLGSLAPSSWRRTENSSKGGSVDSKFNADHSSVGGTRLGPNSSKDSYEDIQLDTAWLDNNLADDQRSEASQKLDFITQPHHMQPEHSVYSRV